MITNKNTHCVCITAFPNTETNTQNSSSLVDTSRARRRKITCKLSLSPKLGREKSAVMEPLEMYTSTHRCQAGTFNSNKKGAQMSCIAAIQSLGIFLDTDTIITEHWQKGKSNLQVTLPGEGKPSFLFISFHKHFLFTGSLTSSRNTLKTIIEANCLLQWIKRCVLPFRPT